MAGLLGRMDEHLQQLYGRPTFHLGLGLLGRRDQDFGRAASGAFNDYANWQTQNQLLQNQQQAYQLAQAEEMRQQQALQVAQQQAAAQAAALQKAGFDPNLPSNVLGQQAQLKYAPLPNPSTFAEQMAMMQTPEGQERLKAYYAMKNKGTGTNVEVKNVMPGPLRPKVEGNSQQKIINMKLALDDASIAKEMLEMAPELGNIWARTASKAGSLIAGLGQFVGSDTIKVAGETIRPDPLYTEDGLKITPRNIQAQMQSLKNSAADVFKPDVGALTEREQTDYKAATRLLDSDDAQEQIDGVILMEQAMRRRIKRLSMDLRVSGAAVPGEQQMPRPASPVERDQLPPGTQYIAPDGSVRVRK